MTDLYNEQLRPQFHFTARENWLNDPNGLVYYRDEYHMFFQHNPAGCEWGNMTWGHAVSKDLLHWQQLDNALLPDELGTMFSGSAVVDHDNTAGFGAGALVLIYTAAGSTSDESKGQPFTQCIAYSNDGRTFTKYAGNPVLDNLANGNRDPKVVRHEPTKSWIMTLYLSGNDFAFFSSPNLINWTHLQTITIPECAECPDFFPMNVDGNPEMVKWVWTAANARYLTGDFDGKKFTPDEPEVKPLAGEHYYAVQTFSELPGNRRVQIAWLNGLEYPEMPFNQQMGIPVELKLRQHEDGLRLSAAPVHELDKLREYTSRRDITEISADDTYTTRFDEIQNAGMDINIEITVNDASEITTIICDKTIVTECPINMAKDKKVTIRALIDRSSIEFFLHDGRLISIHGYHPNPETQVIKITPRGGSITLKKLEIYGLKSIWK